MDQMEKNLITVDELVGEAVTLANAVLELDEIIKANGYNTEGDDGIKWGDDILKWTWLNTLFGYNIGIDNALSLIGHYDNNGINVRDFTPDDKASLMDTAKELGLDLNFTTFQNDMPKIFWPFHR